MEDFEIYQKNDFLEDTDVINQRQEVHTAWSRLQMLVEEREALIRKAINYHSTFLGEVYTLCQYITNFFIHSENVRITRPS